MLPRPIIRRHALTPFASAQRSPLALPWRRQDRRHRRRRVPLGERRIRTRDHARIGCAGRARSVPTVKIANDLPLLPGHASRIPSDFRNANKGEWRRQADGCSARRPTMARLIRTELAAPVMATRESSLIPIKWDHSTDRVPLRDDHDRKQTLHRRGWPAPSAARPRRLAGSNLRHRLGNLPLSAPLWQLHGRRLRVAAPAREDAARRPPGSVAIPRSGHRLR
jgi:hypothetical protein